MKSTKDDYIKRSAARHVVLHQSGDAALVAIDNIPPEDVAPVVRGEWIILLNLGIHIVCECSKCGHGRIMLPDEIFDYCEKCGSLNTLQETSDRKENTDETN